MIAGVILAAGDSSRMGFPKQLAEYKGKTILETVVDTVTSNLDETVVVLGHENDTITEKLDFKESTILINENWEEGIVSSIRTALFYLSLIWSFRKHKLVFLVQQKVAEQEESDQHGYALEIYTLQPDHQLHSRCYQDVHYYLDLDQ